MKVLSCSVLYKGASVTELAIAKELSSVGFFQRGTVGDFLSFFSRTLVERTDPGTRHSVQEQDYICYTFVRADKLAGVLITDQE